METLESIRTDISTSPLVGVKLTSIIPYIILHGVPVNQLNNLMSYFIAMTSGLGLPCFVIGIWSFYATTGLSSEEEIIARYPNIDIYDAYFDLTTTSSKLLILRQQGECRFGQENKPAQEVGEQQRSKREKGISIGEKANARSLLRANARGKRKDVQRQEIVCPSLVDYFPCPVEGIGYKRWFAQEHARASNYQWIVMLDKNVGPIQRCINRQGQDYFGMGEPKGAKCCFMTFTETVAAIQEREADHDYVSYFANKEFDRDGRQILKPVMWGVRVGLTGSSRSVGVSGASYKFYIQYLGGIPEDIKYRWEHMTFGEDFAYAKLLEKNNLSIRKYGIFSLLDLREMNENSNLTWCNNKNAQIPLQAGISANRGDTPQILNPTRNALQKAGYCFGWRLTDYCDVYHDLVGSYTSTSLLAPALEQNGKIYGQNVALFKLDPKEWDPENVDRQPGIFDYAVEYDYNQKQGYLRGYLPYFLLRERYNQRSNKYATSWLYVDIFARIIGFVQTVTEITTEQADTIQKILLPFPKERDYICSFIKEETRNLVCRPLRLTCNFPQNEGYLAPAIQPRNIRPFLETRRRGRISYKEEASNEE